MNERKTFRAAIAAAMSLLAVSAAGCPATDTGGDPTPTCSDLYEVSPANQCLSEDTFAFFACSPEEDMTDGACFLACVEPLEDEVTLCYDVEACSSDCSTDDASGCQNAYNGAPTASCIAYQDYYIAACDPRGDTSTQACVEDCFESAADCDAFDTCWEACP